MKTGIVEKGNEVIASTSDGPVTIIMIILIGAIWGLTQNILMTRSEQTKILSGMDNFHSEVHDIFLKWADKYSNLFKDSISDPDIYSYGSVFIEHLRQNEIPLIAGLTYLTTRFVYMLSQDFSLEKHLVKLAEIIHLRIKPINQLLKKFEPYEKALEVKGLQGGMIRKMTQNLAKKNRQFHLNRTLPALAKIWSHMPFGFAVNVPWSNEPLVVKNPEMLFNAIKASRQDGDNLAWARENVSKIGIKPFEGLFKNIQPTDFNLKASDNNNNTQFENLKVSSNNVTIIEPATEWDYYFEDVRLTILTDQEAKTLFEKILPTTHSGLLVDNSARRNKQSDLILDAILSVNEVSQKIYNENPAIRELVDERVQKLRPMVPYWSLNKSIYLDSLKNNLRLSNQLTPHSKQDIKAARDLIEYNEKVTHYSNLLKQAAQNRPVAKINLFLKAINKGLLVFKRIPPYFYIPGEGNIYG